MNFLGRGQNRENERGQVIVLLALVLPILVLFAGLALDIGFAYVTKAKLTKAVDAACLMGMKSLSQGQSTAQTLALNLFNANYATSALDSSPPVVNIGFSTNANGNLQINITATATIRTFFMQYLPQWKTITVADTAQALRGKLIMSVILDRSASMNSDGGAAALPTAVTSFVNFFSNTNDEVAMVSFASDARVDVPINYNFITPITNAVHTMNFEGGTFGPGGLTLAQAQNNSIPVQPGQNVTKVAIYFTDGYVNTIQNTLPCTSKWGNTLYNFGGFDSGTTIHFFKPSDGTDWGGLTGTPAVPPHVPTPDCLGVTSFTSQINGIPKTFSQANVTADARYRAIQTANAMRAESPATYIYAIGLGTNVDQAFLKQIANDPSSPTYNPSQPDGLAVVVPNCPSSTCTANLQQVFQTIAAKILLRLTQ